MNDGGEYLTFTDDKPIFIQISEAIENDILRGVLLADERAPSTNELAASLQVNPNTAAKSLALLMSDGILYKKRGVGMFVDPNAERLIREKRRAAFIEACVRPMLSEAALLGISAGELDAIIQNERKKL